MSRFPLPLRARRGAALTAALVGSSLSLLAGPAAGAAMPDGDTGGEGSGGPGGSTSAMAHYVAELGALNGSGSSGRAVIDLDRTANTVTVQLEAHGLAPGLPHAQHLHGALDGSTNTCPPATADTDGDGLVSVAEGAPFYGGIQVSLTTEGDTSADSALAVERFPVADADGHLSYARTIELTDEVADALASLHVVQHGVDLDGSGAYDGEARSSIDPSLPLEATIPANCGTIAESDDGMTGDGMTGDGMERHVAELTGLNGSGASGTATVVVDRANEQIHVKVQASGLAPGVEHLQHLHGVIDRENTCPTPDADTDGDGLVTVAEGASAYGPILIWLNGDDGRFPTADADGDIDFKNSYALSDRSLEIVDQWVVVQHGIDLDGSGAYDGEARSSINPSLPLEATIPATCGALD
jgi:hypothetical protein